MAILDDDNIKIDIIRLNNNGYSNRTIAQMVGVGKSTVGDFLSKKSHKAFWDRTGDKGIASGSIYDHHKDVKKAASNRFILTSAQNNTFVHSGFLRSLENMAEQIGADILVGTFLYNTSGYQSPYVDRSEVWFDNKLENYIANDPIQLADGLMWYGELNILPTAVNPLSGLDSYTKTKSGIVPHAKVQLESLPTHKAKPCRFLYSTGAVTKKNYIHKKAGQKAAFHHVFGALFVEVDDNGDWFVRQLVADSDTGSFYDLDALYTPDGFTTGHNPEAVVYGDIHIEMMNRTITGGAFYDKKSIMRELKPKYQFFHDVSHFSSRNHHSINDPYHKFASVVNDEDSVEAELYRASHFLESVEVGESVNVVVESNHQQALTRWLKEADYKSDPNNALIFLKLQLEVYKAIAGGNKDFNVYEYALRRYRYLANTIFLKEDEQFTICGDIECGCHGHRGISGSRGSVQSFRKMGGRYNVAHSHAAAIKDGVYQAGVLANLDMGYNVGASNWSASSIITYPNGKRTIVTQSQATGNYRAMNQSNQKGE